MSGLLPFMVAGLVVGAVYGLAGVGLVLTYKTSGIFNLAYGALATVAAYVFYWMYVRLGVPLPVCLIVAVPVLGAVIGAGFEPFAEKASRAKLAVQVGATVGLFLVVQAGATLLFGPNSLAFPQFILPNVQTVIGGVTIQGSQIVIFALSIVATAGLYLFLRTARLGKAMRAVVDNSELVSLAGTNPTIIRRWAWIVGCFFAALSGLALAPSVGLDPATLTLLVVAAFGAAAIGGFASLALTWAGGIVLGLVTSISTKYFSSTSLLGGLPASLPFIVLFVAILLYPRRRLFVRKTELARNAISAWRAPTSLQVLAGVGVLAFFCTVPSFAGFRIGDWTIALTYVIILLSLGLLVRTSGHVSLCHVTFAAIGAVAFSKLEVGAGLPWLLALLMAGLVVVPIGALLAIPAMRLGGLFLALATLGFGLLVQAMFYQSNLMFGVSGSGVFMPEPSLRWLGLTTSDAGFYYVVLAMTLAVALIVVVITRSRLGRLLRAIADSSKALSANGATVNVTHVLVFCISAYLAAIAGALAGMAYSTVNGLSYDPTTSLVFLAVVVISVGAEPWYALPTGLGLGLIPAYITASVAPYYLQLAFGLSAMLAAVSGSPALPQPIRRRIEGFRINALTRIGRESPARPAQKPTGERQLPHREGEQAAAQAARRTASLSVVDLCVRFGGLAAVDGISLRAEGGRITGLIGPNGAGKTTTFNACNGFIRPTAGRIWLNNDVDISGMGPARRARLGLGRTFQQMELFDSMTVLENVSLGREASMAGANVFSQLACWPRQRAEIRQRADEAVGLCEVGSLVDKPVGGLSTGQRRLVELARAVAGPFSLLLLDEPSSGLDRSETQDFGRILERLASERGTGILLVEHDMELVMQVCDHIYVMDYGELIFEGSPAEVRASAVVQAAYLGSVELAGEQAPGVGTPVGGQ